MKLGDNYEVSILEKERIAIKMNNKLLDSISKVYYASNICQKLLSV